MRGRLRKWTAEERAELEKMWHDGATAPAIGERFGIAAQVVWRMVHRFGLSPRPRGAQSPNGWTSAEDQLLIGHVSAGGGPATAPLSNRTVFARTTRTAMLRRRGLIPPYVRPTSKEVTERSAIKPKKTLPVDRYSSVPSQYAKITVPVPGQSTGAVSQERWAKRGSTLPPLPSLERVAPVPRLERIGHGTCLWVDGERGSYRCCDRPATRGAWCELHADRALFVPPMRRAA